MKWKCHTCGQEFVSRTSNKRSAKDNMLRAARNHYKKKHPNTIGNRISRSHRNKNHNPDIAEFIETMQQSPRKAAEIYKGFQEKQKTHIRRTILALSPVLPKEITLSWAIIEAVS